MVILGLGESVEKINRSDMGGDMDGDMDGTRTTRTTRALAVFSPAANRNDGLMLISCLRRRRKPTSESPRSLRRPRPIHVPIHVPTHVALAL